MNRGNNYYTVNKTRKDISQFFIILALLCCSMIGAPHPLNNHSRSKCVSAPATVPIGHKDVTQPIYAGSYSHSGSRRRFS